MHILHPAEYSPSLFKLSHARWPTARIPMRQAITCCPSWILLRHTSHALPSSMAFARHAQAAIVTLKPYTRTQNPAQTHLARLALVSDAGTQRAQDALFLRPYTPSKTPVQTHLARLALVSDAGARRAQAALVVQAAGLAAVGDAAAVFPGVRAARAPREERVLQQLRRRWARLRWPQTPAPSPLSAFRWLC